MRLDTSICSYFANEASSGGISSIYISLITAWYGNFPLITLE